MTILAAFTAEQSAHSLEMGWLLILFQLLLIVGVAQMAGMTAVRLRQPRAVGEMMAGLALGPSLLGWVFPDWYAQWIGGAPRLPLSILSQIGLIFLLFQIGMEFEFSHLKSKVQRRTVSWVWMAGIAFPLILGFFLGWFSAPTLHPSGSPLHFSIFMGIALSITALPILGRILIELKLEKSKLGVLAISCAAMDDVVAWILLAGATAFVNSTFIWSYEIKRWSGILIYVIALTLFVRRFFVHRLQKWLKHGSEGISFPVLGMVMSLLFCSAIVTQKLGIFAIFGAFFLGVLLHDQTNFVEHWKKQIGSLVMAFFVPLFFTFTGLRVDIPALNSLQDLAWLAVIIATATLAKWGGCYLAAKMSGLDHPMAMALGVLMNTRALMELVVANIALDLGVISTQVFSMLVIMAIVSTIITGPVLHRLLNRHPQLRL